MSGPVPLQLPQRRIRHLLSIAVYNLYIPGDRAAGSDHLLSYDLSAYDPKHKAWRPLHTSEKASLSCAMSCVDQ